MSTKWCRFQAAGKVSYGRIDGDSVIAVDGAPWDAPADTATRHPLSSVKLLVPVIPATFYCVGLNYPDHLTAAAKRRGVEPKFPERPDIGYRAVSALCAHEDDIVKPKDAGELFQYEGELVAVIGKRARNVPLDKALDYVFGWTIGNDVSERTWQRNDRTNFRAKNCDTFKPMGPWIVSGVDYHGMKTVIRLNGKEVDRFPTDNMIHDVETYIAEASKYCTFYPGDIIWMGTEGSPLNMKPGDVIEIEISGIGTLRNKVVAGQ